MSAYISFEWLKMSRRWMPRIIVLLMLGLVVLAFWGQGTRSADQFNLMLPRGWLVALVFASFFAPFFWPVLGGSWAGNEYGWGTIRMVLSHRPYRIQQALSALAVLILGAGVALLAVVVTGTLGGLVVGELTHHTAFASGVMSGAFLATLVKGMLAAWYVATFYLVLAYAAGTIFRSAAVGIGIGIGATLAQVVLRGIFFNLGGVWRNISEHFPIIYTNDFTTRVVSSSLQPGSSMASVDPSSPSIASSLIALAIFIAVLLAATMMAVRSRDVTA